MSSAGYGAPQKHTTSSTRPAPSLSVGQGIYRSTDAGKSWTLAGLEKTGRIGRVVLACALGHAYGPQPEPDNAEARARIFYGDGRELFRLQDLPTGLCFHEAKLGDLDGDGDLDILNKPYTLGTPRIDVWLNNGTKARKRR